ncbi:hypothetical protein [Sporosarcina sp.]|uniref:hypothetical protein n=1 Tax=Sporosarcina sp. TaxID=49982 RepID=UPI002601D8DB|nr:hypothetical protein [Sporosarcina sp.]
MLFTTIAPANVMASLQTQNDYSITVFPGAEGRTLTNAEVYMRTANRGWINFNQVMENGNIQLKTNTEGLPSTSKVLLNIRYVENEKQYQLIEEVILTKEQNQFTIPNSESLYVLTENNCSEIKRTVAFATVLVPSYTSPITVDPNKDLSENQELKLVAKVSEGQSSSLSKPVTVKYSPDVPEIKDPLSKRPEMTVKSWLFV